MRKILSVIGGIFFMTLPPVLMLAGAAIEQNDLTYLEGFLAAYLILGMFGLLIGSYILGVWLIWR